MVGFDRQVLKAQVVQLAAQGVFLGTSSCKYPDWRGMLYEEARYVYRGKVAEGRLERNCLDEYGEVFKTVCVDAAYYAFPTLSGLASQVPSDFRFAFKVTDQITLKRYPNLPRFICGPFALSVFLGQKLSSLGLVHVYEYQSPGYTLSFSLKT